MNANKVGLATSVLVIAGLAVGCGGSGKAPQDSPINFAPVTGDNFTANPGAFQTDGVAVPPGDVTMVGDPVAAQAVVNAGLPQGTVTSTSSNTTVYYPPAPEVPGIVAPARRAVPEPMSRPAGYRPWDYTPQQLDVYRTICDTGRWAGWIAGIERQTQVCWNLYGRQLGVRPWTPDQPRPWQRPGYPRPWWDQGYRPDVPVMWVYPRSWTRPKPQPIISVSITINLGDNPYRRVNPRFTDPFYPVWAITPGRVVEVRDQGRIVAPVYTVSTTTTTTTTTTTVTAPVAPGVVLLPLPTSPKVEPILAVPGAAVAGNANTDAKVTAPVPAALQGAVIQAGSVAQLDAAIGTSVSATVASTAPAKTGTTTAGTTVTGTTATGTTAAGTSAAGTTPAGPPAAESTAPGTTAPSSPAAAPTTAAPTTAQAPPTTTVPVPTTTVAPPPVRTTTLAPVPTTTVPVPTTTVAPPPVRTTTLAPVPTTTVPVPTTTVAPVPTTTVPKPIITVPKRTTVVPVPTTTTTPPPAAGE